jgi:hypothetical protein
MTSSRAMEMRFDLEMFNGTTGYAVYANVVIASSLENYRISIGPKTASDLRM